MNDSSKILIFDTHCHLSDEELIGESIKIVSEAKVVGIEMIMNVGYDKKTNMEVVRQIDLFPNLPVALGIHPNSDEDFSEENIIWIEKMILSKKEIVAIGEIGLDFYREKTEKEKQKTWFRKQLAVAKKHNLPVLLHIREAFKEAHQIVFEEKIRKGLVHCFTGNLEIAKKFIDLGFYISFAGNITYKKKGIENELENVVRNIPLERILIETDSPYLSPEPLRGKKNYPKNIVYTLERISEIKNIDIKLAGEIIFKNSLELFKIDK